MEPESALSFYFWLVRMILWGQFPIDDGVDRLPGNDAMRWQVLIFLSFASLPVFFVAWGRLDKDGPCP